LINGQGLLAEAAKYHKATGANLPAGYAAAQQQNTLLGGADGGPNNTLAGEELLKSLPPGAQASVKALIDYRYPATGAQMRTPAFQQLLQLAQRVDPTFDSTQYDVRRGIQKEYQIGGKSAANLKSLNTLIGHLSTLKGKADKLKNTDITPWNWLVNQYRSNTGDPRTVGFDTAANAVDSELATLFKNAGATDQEIKAWRSVLGKNASAAQFDEFIQTGLGLMNSRLNSQKDAYEKAMGRPAPFEWISPEAQKVLDELMYKVQSAPGTAPAGAPAAPAVSPGASTAPAPTQGLTLDRPATVAELQQAFGDKWQDAARALQAQGLLATAGNAVPGSVRPVPSH